MTWNGLLNSTATQSQKAVTRLEWPRTIITFSSGPHTACEEPLSLTQPRKTNKQYRVGNNISLNYPQFTELSRSIKSIGKIIFASMYKKFLVIAKSPPCWCLSFVQKGNGRQSLICHWYHQLSSHNYNVCILMVKENILSGNLLTSTLVPAIMHLNCISSKGKTRYWHVYSGKGRVKNLSKRFKH